MKDTSFEQYLKEHSDFIGRELSRTLQGAPGIPATLMEAMEYSLMAGGKRMRPILVLAACEAVNGRQEAAVPAAMAIEMVHTYSLIHDDLPAMDNDDYRRGRLTNHKVFGDAMAILAGDALLTFAFQTVTRCHKEFGVPAEQVLSIVEELSLYSGPAGMVGGQAADMLGEQGVTRLEELEFIHLHKTSDLIVFSLLAGGRVGGADDKQLQALRHFGTNIGLAFQIQDDILDLIGDETKLGKKVNSDIKQSKVTYPYFIGLEASQSKVTELTRSAKQALLDSGLPKPERLLQIADFLMKRDH